MDLKVLTDINLKVWMPLAATGDQCGQQVRSQRWNRPDRNSPAKGWAVSKLLGRVFDLQEDSFGPFQKDDPSFRGNGFVAQPVKKLVPKLLLKFYNLLA